MKRILALTLLLAGLARADISVQLTTNASGSSCGQILTTEYENGNCPEGPPNSAPVWNTTPAPTATAGVVSSYSLANANDTTDTGQHASDANGDGLTFVNETGCTLPTGVTIDNTNDEIDFSTGTSAGTTTGCVFSVDDGTASPVNSSSFSITISASSGFWATMTPGYDSAIEGFACYGCNWESFWNTNPTRVVHRVTNTNTSGAGSFDAALAACTDATWDIVVFETSGMPDYATDSVESIDCDNLTIVGASAPSPGFYVRDLMLKPLNATRQLWSHTGVFHGNATTQGTGDCVQVGGNAGATNSIVFLNFGCTFAYDESYSIYIDATQVSIIQSMSVTPIGSGGGAQLFHMLIGDKNGSTSSLLVARNSMSHALNRSPKLNGGHPTAAANNLLFNCTQSCIEIANGKAATIGFDMNVEDNVIVDGPNQSATMKPIVVRNNIEAGTRAFLGGNRDFGLNADDSTQTNLVLDQSGGNISFQGGRITSAWPNGFETTTIGAGDNNLRTFVETACQYMGPRPTDTGRPGHYDRQCQEMLNRIDGSGAQGAQISSAASHPDGIPTVAENTCDLDTPNSCGANKPAIPSEAASIATWRTWINDMRCSVEPAGATGC